MQQPHHTDGHPNHIHAVPITPVESNLLSPYSSHVRSNSASPTGNTNTPADTIYTVDYYPSSDAFSNSDIPDDPYFGADFTNVDVPAFLGDTESTQSFTAHQVPALRDNGTQHPTYPMSPDKTPSIPATSSFDKDQGPSTDLQGPFVTGNFSVRPRPLAKSNHSNNSAPQLTPDTNGDSWSSDDGLAPTAPVMASQSPRVTVSMWNKDDDTPIQGIERSFTTGTEESRKTMRAPHSIAGDLAGEPSYDSLASIPRNAQGSWLPNTDSGHRGLAPGNRPTEEVPSPNQLAARREREKRNKAVSAWVARSTSNPSDPPEANVEGSYSNVASAQHDDDNIPAGEIPLGHTTENKHNPGQTYLNLDGPGGPITQTDFDIIRGIRNWGDGPMIHAIQSGEPSQPITSQLAIEKFNRQCQDNDSIISHAATWGTRRRSLPSVVDMDGVISGNIFKKLSLSNHSRRPSFMKRIPSLVRKPSASQLLKRKGSNASEIQPEDLNDQGERRESKDSLAPPARSSSWGIGNINKKPTPSLNTALFEMATGAATIGTSHALSGSISNKARSSSINTTPISSPKSPFASLGVPPVMTTRRRPRSKTELPRSSNSEPLSHPNLIGMLKKQGGPPVAQLARTHQVVDQDDEDDEDEDAFDDEDFKVESSKVDITPTFAGFQEHILRLNPRLGSSNGQPNPNNYLVDRIAHQMVVRYKQLLHAKSKHLDLVNRRSCPAGPTCVASGGSAIISDRRLGDRGIDPLSTHPDSSDGDTTPLEGGISPESFPQGIPMPPTGSLPSEFECQLCFSRKKFQKPSDWTKHVHEDVQPFTCTWERCRDPKMFKRKADWVRHENEGHRHLEWWECDVEGCKHKCFRRDNFLQHLVREHKFAEPKVKTKAAIKKAGGVDRTWQKVEQCHSETDSSPTSEPCRFCHRTFPTWKKLTVHLAKHMEHISLPVLKLVAAKHLDADTVISPVQDPPPRSFGIPPAPVIKQDPHQYSPQEPHMANSNPGVMDYHNPQSTMGYPNMASVPLQTSYYTQSQAAQQYNDVSHNPAPAMIIPQPYSAQPSYPNMPVTTSSYDTSANAYMNVPVQDTEPFPAFNSLGIQDPTGGMGYDNLGNPVMQNMEQYGSNAGSVSPFSHSPHVGHSGTFYNP
ncbi:hypothetical protein F5X99DRAFT_416967 [Biscogniauxia marginata]|nr:hypothetical protein F5X99DRAFT_416967 [Biscogniauxia marginata]